MLDIVLYSEWASEKMLYTDCFLILLYNMPLVEFIPEFSKQVTSISLGK